MPRERFLKQSLGAQFANIKNARILVVGAGGIGCELLKNLVCTGFGEIHVVDLDTIDLSNLNRQFLFRHAHIKKSKALVAREAASKFNPNVKIEAHHANIKDPQFNVDWFRSFVIVFNALDNLDARRHVNRMCLAADVPLIESGTTGFNGQVQPIRKRLTECYDCAPKETPKSFPVCTIRSTPSQPIHCIVWAKSYLFNELFGISEDQASDLDHTSDENNKEEIAELKKEAAALKEIRASMGSTEFPQKVFDKVFTQDIKRLLGMEDMWKMRKPPTALDFETVNAEAANVDRQTLADDQKDWSLAENFAVFADSLIRLSDRLDKLRAAQETGNAPPILTFDKDDRDTLDFVAAAANLRSITFGIETKSEFDIKQMAGNIIPAIATTNATTAALCVLQAFKIMRGDWAKAKMVFLTKSTERVINKESLRPPRPDCGVCATAYARLVINTEKTTLESFVKDVLVKKLGYNQDEVEVSNNAGVWYDPDMAMDDNDNLEKTLSEINIVNDSTVIIRGEGDEGERVNLELSISNMELDPSAAAATSESFTLVPDLQTIPKKTPAVTATTTDAAPSNGRNLPTRTTAKRSADEAELDNDQTAKRGKVAEEKKDVTVVEDDGAIMIDDD
ncbi:hypothetical protein D6D13_01295 [Aureobasidium pullulans]|uniref:Ubiquitin-activating enzyme E1-like n=1 Tax=Aureobasidium pullulans TaxID=5580 RepID=A0A4S9FH24_AURPU|nr:hypothetical protein D6D13_01295 [Aureobasidium pullulans]THX28125.1 hypothetical protein D6D12_05052 [Aureobasidium pullulans]THX47275.1 hypothetical protein D6D11_06498 [Aureobasidium pullulans]